MKTDSELLFLSHCDTYNHVHGYQRTQELHTLTTEEIERLIQLVVKDHTFHSLECIVSDYLLQALQILADRRIEESTIEHITVEQLDVFGIPSGQCDQYGNDLY